MASLAMGEGKVSQVPALFGRCLWWFSGQWRDPKIPKDHDINLDIWIKVAGGWSTLDTGIVEKTPSFMCGRMVTTSSFLSQLFLPCKNYTYASPPLDSSFETVSLDQESLDMQANSYKTASENNVETAAENNVETTADKEDEVGRALTEETPSMTGDMAPVAASTAHPEIVEDAV